jgi:regulator of nucleoside diphosphate kinase
MHAVVHGERTLTDLDFVRLKKLLSMQLPCAFAEMLDGVEITDPREIPIDVVTMYSRIEILDVHTFRRQVLTVCYPRDAEPVAGFISVLSPVGSSLLGLKV